MKLIGLLVALWIFSCEAQAQDSMSGNVFYYKTVPPLKPDTTTYHIPRLAEFDSLLRRIEVLEMRLDSLQRFWEQRMKPPSPKAKIDWIDESKDQPHWIRDWWCAWCKRTHTEASRPEDRRPCPYGIKP